MKIHFAHLTTAALAFLVAACASGPPFSGVAPPVSNQGDVYLYRKADFFASGQSFDVTLDGKDVGKLYNASFLHLRLPGKSFTLTVAPGGTAKPRSITLRPELGTTLYYEFDFQFDRAIGTLGNSSFPNASIQPRSRDRALEDLKELKASM